MSQSNPKPASRFHWRRLFQFRLRTLLIFTTIIAAALGWWSYKARQQREAVAALSPYFWQYDFQASGTDRPFYSPIWLVRFIGDDYFANVSTLLLGDINKPESGRVASDADMALIKTLASLQNLGLGHCHVSDCSLIHLKNMTSLKYLYLDHTRVSDAGLEHLKNLTSLHYLTLANTNVTDTGVEQLQKALPRCKIVRWSP